MGEQGSHSFAALLGVVQGLTEFLPVSSSGHLIIVSWLWEGKPLPLAVNTALHFGTLIAILLFFWRDWFAIARGCQERLFSRKPNFYADTLLPALLIGSLPAGIIGVLGKDAIENLFPHPGYMALPLALVGFVLWFADRLNQQKRSLGALTLKDGLLIGLAQACALVPGVSRSGATITCARFLQLDRASAARFSFLLGTPAMAGAALLHLPHFFASLNDPNFYVGVGTSCLVGCLTIKFFLHFIRKFGFLAFALYRTALAAVILYISL